MTEETDARTPSYLGRWFTTRAYEYAITAIIALNAVLMALETYPSVRDFAGPAIDFVNSAVVVIFVIELSLKLVAFRGAFFRSGWNWFDVAVITLSLLPGTEAFAAMRALRAVRLLRLIAVLPSLRRVVMGFLNAIPSLGSVILILALMLFVSSLVATRLYGAAHPDLFGSLGASSFSLFVVMTLEGWNEIAWQVMETHPSAWAFFVGFIMLISWAVLNLFIGVIVDSMQQHTREEETALERQILTQQELMLGELQALRSELQLLQSAHRNGEG
jgi:voltage-gated sodium channel